MSPWPPNTTAVTFSTETSSSWAMKVRKRAVSRTPAMPMTRFLLNFETWYAVQHIASSGLVTRIRMQFGEYFTACSVAVLHHLVVGQQKIVAAHARLAREAGRDNDDVGVRRGLVIIGAGDIDVVAFDRARLQHVEAFALGHAFDNIHQHDIGQFFVRDVHSAVGADIAGARQQ